MVNEKKRILIISILDIWSMGHQKGAQSLFETLWGYADAGHEVYFLTSSRNEHYEKCQHNNIKVFYVDVPFSPPNTQKKYLNAIFNKTNYLFFLMAMYKKACELSVNIKFDLFYGYEIHAIPVAYLLSKKFKVPNVSRFQGTIFYPILKKYVYYLLYLEHYIAFKIPADLYIMTNDGTEGDKVLKSFGIDHRKINFLVNGINKDAIKLGMPKDDFKSDNGIPIQNKVVICVSRLVKWKHVDRLIWSTPKIITKYQDVTFVVIGDGPEKTSLNDLSISLGVNNHVKFIGSIPHSEVLKYMQIADIFVSLYDLSNVGNPLLEAMNNGKCIVTLDNGATKDFIQNYDTGILLNLDEISDLPSVLVSLLNDESLRLKLGRNAANFAATTFKTWPERMDIEVESVCNLCHNH